MNKWCCINENRISTFASAVVGCAFFLLPCLLAAQPVIIKQPADHSQCSGFLTLFEVTATGASPLSYQWQVDKKTGTFTPVPNGVSTSLSERASISMNGYKYRMIITDANGQSVISNEATLTVNPSPTVRTSPSPQTTCEGGSAKFSVAVPPSIANTTTYRWVYVSPSGSSQTILGETQNELTLANVSIEQNGYQYQAEVTNAGCTVSSNAANLTVTPGPLLNITDPTPVCAPSTVNLTLPATTQGSAPGLSFSYYTDAQGTLVLANPNSVSVGGVYYIRGSVTASSSGCKTSVKPVNVKIGDAPTVRPVPPITVCNGGNTGILLIDPNNGQTTTFTWVTSDPNNSVTGETNQTTPTQGPILQTLTTSATSSQQIKYIVTPLSPPCSPGTPVQIDVTVSTSNGPDLKITPPIFEACTGSPGSVALSSTTTIQGTAYRWTPLLPSSITGGQTQTIGSNGPLTASLSLANGGTTPQNGNYLVTAFTPVCEGQQLLMPVVVKPLPSLTLGETSVSLCSGNTKTVTLTDPSPSGINTRYKWTVQASASITGVPDVTTPRSGPLTINPQSTSDKDEVITYTVTPVGGGCDGMPVTVTATVQPGVTITKQLADNGYCPGDAIELKIEVAGGSGVTYQWTKDNQPLDGASGNTYTVASAQNSDAGAYAVTISNACGTVKSNMVNILIGPNLYFNTSTAIISNKTLGLGDKVTFEYRGPAATLEWDFGDGSPKSDLPIVSNYYYETGRKSPVLKASKSATCFIEFTLDEILVGGVDPVVITSLTENEEAGVRLYPNPCGDFLFISSAHNINEISVWSMQGELIEKQTINGYAKTLDTARLRPGLYILQVMYMGGIANSKIIKQ